MTPYAHTKVADVTMWFKHIDSSALRTQFEALGSEEEITLRIDDTLGRWRRMKTGKDGRMVNGLKPVGPMKDVWMRWFEEERGKVVSVQPVTAADDLAANASVLMTEWNSDEDEAAFAHI